MKDFGVERVITYSTVQQRKCNLDEKQLWSLVLLAVEAIEREITNVSEFLPFCLDDLHITKDGRHVELTFPRCCTHTTADYLPPELDSKCQVEVEHLCVAKMYLYTLGCWLNEVLMKNPNVRLDASLILHSVVNMMKLQNCKSRIDLPTCKQIIINQVKLLCLLPEQILESLRSELSDVVQEESTSVEEISVEDQLRRFEIESAMFVYPERATSSSMLVVVLRDQKAPRVNDVDKLPDVEASVSVNSVLERYFETSEAEGKVLVDLPRAQVAKLLPFEQTLLQAKFQRFGAQAGVNSINYVSSEASVAFCTKLTTASLVVDLKAMPDTVSTQRLIKVAQRDETSKSLPIHSHYLPAEDLFVKDMSDSLSSDFGSRHDLSDVISSRLRLPSSASWLRLHGRSCSSLPEVQVRIASLVRSFSEPCLATGGSGEEEGTRSDNSSLLCLKLDRPTLLADHKALKGKQFDQGGLHLEKGDGQQEDYSTVPERLGANLADEVAKQQPLTAVLHGDAIANACKKPPVPVRTKKKSIVTEPPPNLQADIALEQKATAAAPFVRNSFRGIRNSRHTSWRGAHAQKRSRTIAPNDDRAAAATTGDHFNGDEVVVVVRSSLRRRGNGKADHRTMTVPAFRNHDRLPSIRLKAPSTEQRKLFCKIRDGNVLVVLLNGQRVDVACKINCTALDIFEVVCTHTNLVERHFFGLTYLKDGEYFFLEPEQKVYRFAPPGWRHQANENARVAFCLYLRLKFYPVVLDFVKTELTMYHIYLQLRHDIMDERLQCEQESAYQLAALALQAEVGDRPSQELYFEPQSYLPPAFLKQENIDRIRARLAQMHFRHAGKSSHVAEVETKPSHMLTPSPLGDPDTGVPLWIGIMNRGLVIFEEKGGFRIPLSHHPWHLTQTLQFDHKKFYIVARKSQNGLTLNKLTFFTDSYRKSSYFVNFAAAQHRFCMKMRTWASTLTKERRSGRCADNTASSALVDPQGNSSETAADSPCRPHFDMQQPPNGAHQERPVDVVSACSATLPRPAVPSRRAKVANESNGQPNKISFLSQDSSHSTSALTNDKTFSGKVSSAFIIFVMPYL
ncbi:hypothetical protein M514_06861 [Trichuris suis]|uniref:FERM domain-containing protein n=1 Tax=Trichuris suis TaxID=68888 RepID=A0A085NBA8_9BILA|nr:hypothetical protein M513_06861 [Trichuris suis]KFD66754.1 hypothetical protein M514_06861 [Trichuris suis]